MSYDLNVVVLQQEEAVEIPFETSIKVECERNGKRYYSCLLYTSSIAYIPNSPVCRWGMFSVEAAAMVRSRGASIVLAACCSL